MCSEGAHRGRPPGERSSAWASRQSGAARRTGDLPEGPGYRFRMLVRPITSADADPTFRLWRAVIAATYDFLPAHTEVEDRAYFQNQILAHHDVFVAEVEGAIVGYMAIQDDYIDRLYVAVEHQRQGVGSALLAEARTRSPSRLRLCTHQQNHGACKFYERQGFLAVRYGLSPPPECVPDVEYWWRPLVRTAS